MSEIWEKLKEPFAPDRVSWRVGATSDDKGLALAYIDARDVMERLDEVCGPGGWQDSYTETAKGRVLCTIRIRIGDEWIAKSDGAGNTDVEADKGGISDAFKRAAVKWGIGRYLYDVDSPWVKITKRGKSSFIDKDELPRLARMLASTDGQAPARQNNPSEKKALPPDIQKAVDDAAAIVAQAEKVLPDEWDAFMDGLSPRLADIGKINEQVHNRLLNRLGAISATLKVGT